MLTHSYDLPIRVLISREGREFVAHALELDLVGYGKTEKSAIREMQDMVHAQLSFASQTNRTELVYHPAPKEFFVRWENAHATALRGSVSSDKPVKMETKAIFVTVTEEQIKEAHEGKFHRAGEPVLA